MVSLRLPKQRVMVVRAPVWKRIVSFIIDLWIIDILLLSPFQNYFSTAVPEVSTLLQRDVVIPAGFIVAMTLIGIIALLYFTLFEYYLGATPGMQLFGLQVGGKRTWWTCLVRNAYALPVFPFSLLLIIEPLYLAFRKVRLLEQWSDTATVQLIAI